MENPAGVDPPEDNAARCPQYTSSEEEQNRPAPTTEDRVAGKRPLVADPSPAETLPAESSLAPKRRWLVRITDNEEEEEEAAQSSGRCASQHWSDDQRPSCPARRAVARRRDEGRSADR